MDTPSTETFVLKDAPNGMRKITQHSSGDRTHIDATAIYFSAQSSKRDREDVIESLREAGIEARVTELTAQASGRFTGGFSVKIVITDAPPREVLDAMHLWTAVQPYVLVPNHAHDHDDILRIEMLRNRDGSSVLITTTDAMADTVQRLFEKRGIAAESDPANLSDTTTFKINSAQLSAVLEILESGIRGFTRNDFIPEEPKASSKAARPQPRPKLGDEGFGTRGGWQVGS